MAKYAQCTRVMFGDTDISALISHCKLLRFPAYEESVSLTISVKRLAVEEDGTLVIHIEPPEEA
jgi:hypothetical protein